MPDTPTAAPSAVSPPALPAARRMARATGVSDSMTQLYCGLSSISIIGRECDAAPAYPLRMGKKEIDPAAAAFGRRLKAARVAAGKTQADVAAIFEIKPQAVGHWETGTNSPTAQQLAELAAEFGADPAELLYGDDVPASIKLRQVGDLRARTLALGFASLPEQLDGKTKDALLGELLQILVQERHRAPHPVQQPSSGPTPPLGDHPRKPPGSVRARRVER